GARILQAPRFPLFPYPPLFRSRFARHLAADRAGYHIGHDEGRSGVTMGGCLFSRSVVYFDGNQRFAGYVADAVAETLHDLIVFRSEEHTSELQSRFDLVCRLLL